MMFRWNRVPMSDLVEPCLFRPLPLYPPPARALAGNSEPSAGGGKDSSVRWTGGFAPVGRYTPGYFRSGPPGLLCLIAALNRLFFLLVYASSAAGSFGASLSFELKLAAGSHERNNVPVCVAMTRAVIGTERIQSVIL